MINTSNKLLDENNINTLPSNSNSIQRLSNLHNNESKKFDTIGVKCNINYDKLLSDS